MEGDTILSFVSTPSFAHTHKDAHTHTHTHTHRHTEREREERNGQERINQHIRARMHVCVMHRYCRWRTHSTLRLGTQLNQFYERLQRQEAFYNYYHNNNNSSSSSNHNQHSNRALNDTIEQHSLPRLEHGQRSDRLEKSGGGGGGGGVGGGREGLQIPVSTGHTVMVKAARAVVEGTPGERRRMRRKGERKRRSRS
mmetsp:Transcript_32575/g.55311  ORF Transcript_32575/g.55311 Transcript_32575/m.55311 type:complete len:197 (+) Transcript_32575:359-949(+)